MLICNNNDINLSFTPNSRRLAHRLNKNRIYLNNIQDKKELHKKTLEKLDHIKNKHYIRSLPRI